MKLLDVEDLTVRFGSHTVVDGVSFSVREGDWLMIVGPNGAGKSTLIKAISRGLSFQGDIRLYGRDIAGYRAQDFAKWVGVLAQSHHVGYSFSVEEVVRLGRYAHSPGFLSSGKDEDEQKISEAIEMTGLRPFLRQSVLTLSGGELQRTFLAQLFAQDPKLLLLDEPTNHLDLVYQRQTLELIKSWIGHSGRAVISVVHDLSLAQAYGSHALLIDRGQRVAYGSVAEVFSPDNLNLVYDMDVYGWMRRMLAQWQG